LHPTESLKEISASDSILQLPSLPGFAWRNDPNGTRPQWHSGDGELRVSVFPVSHQPIEPAVGYRFDYKERSLVISGDTIKDQKLVEAARGVDLLAHEAQNQQIVGQMEAMAGTLQRPRLQKLLGDIPNYHSSPVEAAEQANAAGAKLLLLLYHLTPPPRALEGVFLRGVAAVRPEGVELAQDGQLIELPLDGGAPRVSRLR